MPWLSRKQAAFGHAHPEKFGGAPGLSEWDSATNFAHLPERSSSVGWIRGTKHKAGAIKHPGALTEAAHEHGVSTRQEAQRETHSDNPHIRSRGYLGLRLIKHKLNGPIKKHR